MLFKKTSIKMKYLSLLLILIFFGFTKNKNKESDKNQWFNGIEIHKVETKITKVECGDLLNRYAKKLRIYKM
ncbi:MAG TPA: hypothetical protein DDZ39_08835 [Flavobacteriaceae bacterium]|jgi:hypothetical protein|nr:hypothetical protein [Flavobacteriaceae bacterium]